MTDDYTQAEIVRTLKRIEEKVDGMASGYLPRSEWQVWSTGRDREMRDVKALVEQVRTDMDASHAPWWTWAAIVVAGLSLAVTVIPRLAN